MNKTLISILTILLAFNIYSYSQAVGTTKLTLNSPAGGGQGEFIQNSAQVTGNTYGISFNANSIPRITIFNNGLVGINTPTPQYPLDVTGVVRIKGDGTAGTVKIMPTVNNAESGVSFCSLANGGNPWVLTQGGYGNPGKLIFAFTSPKMVIQQDGHVGIGTANPTKGVLQVKGSFHVENDSFQVFHISANRALVFVGRTAYVNYQADSANPGSVINQGKYSLWVSDGIVSEDYAVAKVANWSDYVFDEKYPLTSLQKLESYIKTNKHLPAIPSEQEVKKNGYSLSRLNNGFLKTMEELTLYAIDQEKKIGSLDQRVQSLEKELEQLKTLILSHNHEN